MQLPISLASVKMQFKNHYHMLRCATAFAELHTGRTTDFKDDTLEIDATKTNVRKNNKKCNVHYGRFLVVFHRESRQYALEPLADASVKKGAPPPPETYNAVAPVVKAKFRVGHIVSSDSAPGLKKAIKEIKNVPHVTVVHKKKASQEWFRCPRSTCTRDSGSVWPSSQPRAPGHSE